MQSRTLKRAMRRIRRLSEREAFEILYELEWMFGWAIPMIYTRDDARQEWDIQALDTTPAFDDEAWDEIRFNKWWRDMATETMSESAHYTISECVTEAMRRRGIQVS